MVQYLNSIFKFFFYSLKVASAMIVKIIESKQLNKANFLRDHHRITIQTIAPCNRGSICRRR
jgi:hypothetical protein